MKIITFRWILSVLIFTSISVLAETDVVIDLKTAQLQVGTYTNRQLWIQPLSVPTINSPSVVLGQRITAMTDTNGVYVLSNAQVSLYHVTVTAPPSRDDFSFFVTATDLGSVNASDILVASASATFPSGSVAWAAAVTDLRYARGSNQPVSFSQVTNALGFVPQPSSGNLTNWSFFQTNVLSPFVNTNGVLGIGSTNWVAELNGGSTNQVLKNPSLTNGVNYGNAFSSVGTSAGDEQFGNGALAQGGSGTAVGANSTAQGANSSALGNNATATGLGATAVGGSTSANAASATVVGFGATSTFVSSAAVGTLATTTRAHQVMLGTSTEEVNVPGKLSVAGETNTDLAVSALAATDPNKRMTSVTIGTGLAYDTSTKTLSSVGASTAQLGSANLTNWSLFDTNVLTPIPNKTGTNDVLGIGATNWVAHLNDGSTNQILLNPVSTNLVNRGNAIRSVGTTASDDQFGLNASAGGGQSVSLGNSSSTTATQSVAVGFFAFAQGPASVAVGAAASAQFTNGMALGAGATSQNGGSTAIGPGSTTSRANQIMLGSGEEVYVPGHLSVAQGITNGALSASHLIATDANKAQQSVMLDNGLAFSGSTLSLSTDSTLSTSLGSLAVVGSALTGLNASSLASGTVPTARLGSGSATSATFLRGDQTWASGIGSGSVTSVALTAPAEFSVAGSPITTSGTLAITKATQSANLVYAGPSSGSAAAPTFRALVASDVPGLSYWSLTGNSGSGAFLGTTDNTPLTLKANNFAVASFLGAGGSTHLIDVILGDITGNLITPAPGQGCSILGGYSNVITTVGGNLYNVIVGGYGNGMTAGVEDSVIGGGLGNVINNNALFATIPGGTANLVSQSYGFAAGRNARAVNQGAFVWADSQNTAFSSSADNSFNVRAIGGMVLTTPSITANSVPQLVNAATSVATDQTSASTTLASTTLSATLVSGSIYTFEITLFANDSVAANGVKVTFDGGSATATTFRCETMITDTALRTASQTTALSTAVTAATITGDSVVKISGFIKVNAGGTFIPQFAQNTHTSGTITLYTGSFMRVTASN